MGGVIAGKGVGGNENTITLALLTAVCFEPNSL